ncbi:MAG: preprotein translocase subunit SecE [Candidatus Peribacteraceae bacterium]|nr:preprotein translocase subunit SecE [Candidatus Peribacteraceae bacterium]MDD5742707.1 preprotein translocase subunit SecE [Candidatus Peribacteraceae bacterium]
MFRKTSAFLRGAVEELHSVRWPTRQQAVRLSLIVIAFVFGTAVIFGIVDFLLARLVTLLLSFT